jgi:hypothetical protein
MHNLGAKVEAWECDVAKLQENQHWWLWSLGGNDYWIGGPVGGRVLEANLAAAPGNGCVAWLWDYNGGWNQKWHLYSSGAIQLAGTSGYLDIYAGGQHPTYPDNGSQAELWQYNGSNNQLFFFN